MIAIVIPAHNEEKTVEMVVKAAEKYGRVIVVNDASTDKTEQIARRCGAMVISNKVNHGLGYSLRAGFVKALEMKADIIITLDADGQHNPDDIPKFLTALNNGYEFVLGERNLSRYPFIKRFGNFFLNIITNFVSGTTLNDTESGFRAIKSSALKKCYLKAERYEIAVEIVFEVGRNRLKTKNVSIISPVYVKGVGFSDGIKNFFYLLHRRKRNLKAYIEDFKYVMKKWL